VNTEETENPQETPSAGRHAAPEGAPRHPAIDLSRDPNPGRPDHAKPEEGECGTLGSGRPGPDPRVVSSDFEHRASSAFVFVVEVEETLALLALVTNRGR
jgi:hypothetical protein